MPYNRDAALCKHCGRYKGHVHICAAGILLRSKKRRKPATSPKKPRT